MTGVDTILMQTSNNFKCESFEIPFIQIMELNSNHITVVKELLMSFENDIWLKDANEIVLKKLMDWKNK